MLKYFYTALLILCLSLPLNAQAESLAQLQTRAAQGDAQAVHWLQKAAEQNSPLAQNSLGVMYSEGLGVPQDFKQAEIWYRKACDNQNQPGCNNHRKLMQMMKKE
ncbi:sel1 repeat family protein [Pasteurellaceae bacterium USgator11]|nr:sel1 repeat family protein [Pasteurellaceae bacterium USgator41]TNG94990.1 sel1 repeat family protein [Pasteurellaceae bacterium UScroc12]TNH01204.1 sel1 repeat family protein [Pasteurellaceae bacterium UScroc31]TNH02546.1 sel1 repeat family protein [Pasteurellaceae bacterium USgator11]